MKKKFDVKSKSKTPISTKNDELFLKLTNNHISQKERKKILDEIAALNTPMVHQIVNSFARNPKYTYLANNFLDAANYGLAVAISTFDITHTKSSFYNYAQVVIANELRKVLRKYKKFEEKESSIYLTISSKDEDLILLDTQPSSEKNVLEEIIENDELAILYSTIEKKLSEVEKRVIVEYYGLYNTVKKTHTEISKEINTSRSNVSRIHSRAIKKLLAHLNYYRYS